MVVIDLESSHRMAILRFGVGVDDGAPLGLPEQDAPRRWRRACAGLRAPAVRPRCGLRFQVRNESVPIEDQGDDADPEGDGSGREMEHQAGNTNDSIPNPKRAWSGANGIKPWIRRIARMI